MLTGDFDGEVGRKLQEKRLELPPGSMVYINARIFHAVEAKPVDSAQLYRIFHAVEAKPVDSAQLYRIFAIDIFKEAGPPHRYTQEIPEEWMASATPFRQKLFTREAYTEGCWK